MILFLNHLSFGQTDEEIINKIPAKTTPKSDIEFDINYDAIDSIRFNVKKQEVLLYKDAHVDYGDMSMDADFITINWANHTVLATYTIDSLGKKIGIPYVKQRDQVFEADTIIYNYETQRGYISGIVTQEGDGYLQGKGALKDEYNQLYIKNGKYTTCNKKHPHFHFKLKKTKLIPGDKVISGPVNLYIDEIPTPLVLPFAIFPLAEEQKSGILIPTFTEQRDRGFMLTDLGYYWSVNDYLGIKFMGDIYSLGGGGLKILPTYKKRYRYSGDLNLQYARNIRGENPYGLESSTDYRFRWNHRQAPRNGRTFSANVNFQTTTFNTNGVNQSNSSYLQNNINSNITYATPFLGKQFNATVKLRHNQNNETGIYNFTLPEVNLSMTRLYPFKFKNKYGRSSSFRSFYESIGVGYSSNFQYLVSNKSNLVNFPFDVIYNNPESIEGNDRQLDLNFSNLGEIFDRGELGMSHRIPISASLKLFKNFSLNPSFNYNIFMYDRQYVFDKAADTTINVKPVDLKRGLFVSQSYSTSATLNTTLYGFYGFSKGAPMVRHQIMPAVGFTYRPDFTEGNYTEIETSEYNGFAFNYEGTNVGRAPRGEQQAITLALRNSFELKVRDKSIKDSLAYKKLKLLDLNLNNSHNFAADSLRWSRFNFNGNTNIFNNSIRFNFNGVFDPYDYDSTANGDVFRVNETGWRLGNLESGSIRMGVDLNKLVKVALKRTKSDSVDTTNGDTTLINNDAKEESQIDPHPYVKFKMPWKFNLNYTARYSQIAFNEENYTQNLSFSAGIDLTKNWAITGRLQYDFINKNFTAPSFSITRKLHCWIMRFNCVPFGSNQYYNFFIGVTAPQFKDLKYNKQKNYIGQR